MTGPAAHHTIDGEERARGEDGGEARAVPRARPGRTPFRKAAGTATTTLTEPITTPMSRIDPPGGEDECEPEGVDGEAERERARERDPRRGRPADRAQEKRARDEEHARCRRSEANREPWAGRRQEVGEEEKRRRERDEADEPSARPDRERGRQGSYPAASSLRPVGDPPILPGPLLSLSRPHQRRAQAVPDHDRAARDRGGDGDRVEEEARGERRVGVHPEAPEERDEEGLAHARAR